jgi:hypothetical protein
VGNCCRPLSSGAPPPVRSTGSTIARSDDSGVRKQGGVGPLRVGNQLTPEGNRLPCRSGVCFGHPFGRARRRGPEPGPRRTRRRVPCPPRSLPSGSAVPSAQRTSSYPGPNLVWGTYRGVTNPALGISSSVSTGREVPQGWATPTSIQRRLVASQIRCHLLEWQSRWTDTVRDRQSKFGVATTVVTGRVAGRSNRRQC